MATIKVGKKRTPKLLTNSERPNCGSAGKESAHNTGDLGSIPGLGRSPREGKGYPLPYSSLDKESDMTE